MPDEPKMTDADPWYYDGEDALDNYLPEPTPTEQRIPKVPGWYWAKWKIPSPGTHEGKELTPSDNWEVVEVWSNSIDPNCDEPLAVSVSGVRETQWPDQFFWGPRIPDAVTALPLPAEQQAGTVGEGEEPEGVRCACVFECGTTKILQECWFHQRIRARLESLEPSVNEVIAAAKVKHPDRDIHYEEEHTVAVPEIGIAATVTYRIRALSPHGFPVEPILYEATTIRELKDEVQNGIA